MYKVVQWYKRLCVQIHYTQAVIIVPYIFMRIKVQFSDRSVHTPLTWNYLVLTLLGINSHLSTCSRSQAYCSPPGEFNVLQSNWPGSFQEVSLAVRPVYTIILPLAYCTTTAVHYNNHSSTQWTHYRTTTAVSYNQYITIQPQNHTTAEPYNHLNIVQSPQYRTTTVAAYNNRNTL